MNKNIDKKYRPTPSFIAVMIGLVLGWFCISVLVALNKHRVEKAEYEAQRTCVTESGHKRVPCP